VNTDFLTLSDNSFKIFNDLLSIQEVQLVNFFVLLQTVPMKILKMSLTGKQFQLFSSCY